MKKQYKHCPFCRAKLESPITKKSCIFEEYAVICRKCFCKGPVKSSKKEAIKAWNDRK